jgi:galactokinase
MLRIVQGASDAAPDAAAFIETLDALDRNANSQARGFFDTEREIIVARAPGRLDVMGGIADYSGSLALQMPIREATWAALQFDSSRRLRIISLSEGERFFEISLADFERGGELADYAAARARFERDPRQRWAGYAAGVFLVLMRERGVRFQEGARILIASTVPEGKGVSSSAALEVAVMQAVVAAYRIAIEGREIAMLCQMVENLVVGAPCGVMDQMTAACGELNYLLALLCQPAEIVGSLAIPDEIGVWGIDSGARHQVTGADYDSVRVAAFMGYRMIAEIAGLEPRQIAPGASLRIDDPYWRGYLANLAPSEFEQEYAARLPERMAGAEFLSRFQATTDPVTRVNPERIYAVRVATAHPIYEYHRARLFAELLSGAASEQMTGKQMTSERVASERRLELLGELMYQSHESYSACGLGSANTDRLIRLAREAGPSRGVYGARITGGGSGGAVAVIGRRDAGPTVADVARRCAEEFCYAPYIFSGSSPGSGAFGHLILKNY